MGVKLQLMFVGQGHEQGTMCFQFILSGQPLFNSYGSNWLNDSFNNSSRNTRVSIQNDFLQRVVSHQKVLFDPHFPKIKLIGVQNGTKFFTSSIKHLVFFFKIHGIINSKANSFKIKRINNQLKSNNEELNKDIDWNVAIDHVKQKAKEDPFVQRYQIGLLQGDVTKSKSPIRRYITRSPTSKTGTSPLRVTVVHALVVSAVQGKQGTWGNPQLALKDKRVIDSGCSRNMTWNMSYLSDFEELNGGYVAFGGNPKGGKITGKGKIKTAKLDFDDVYFVKELKFNLFSISQMCDKKNSVLFSNTECLVLSPDFKLPDENQVLLMVQRENNMYNVNLKNIVPSGDLTCLFAKATIDESNLWHRRLGHINFKTINKLVKGNLVRGLPIKVFENDHTCVACKKGKQHRASCTGPTWLFDIDSLTRTMNYQPVTAGNQSYFGAGFHDTCAAEKAGEEVNQTYVLFSVWSASSTNPQNNDDDATLDGKEHDFDVKKSESVVILFSSSNAQTKKQDDKTKIEDKGKSHVESFTRYIDLNAEFKDCSENSKNKVNASGSSVPTVGQNSLNNTNTFSVAGPSISVAGPSNTAVSLTYGKSSFIDTSQLPNDPDMPDQSYSNNKNSQRSSCITIIGDLSSTTQTRSMTIAVKDQGFEDPDYPDKVYKVVKALYGLHQAPRAWYETLATYLLENGFHRGTIDQALFIKKQKGDILLVQIYVDDIIFGATNKDLCRSFEKLMKDKFQMSSMGELTFFLGLQVKQKKDGIFISQDKYVAEILRKFGLTEEKSASTPIDTEKPVLKDPDGEDADVYIYKSMIGSLMYLTSLRPDIMFAVCACAHFQVTPQASHLHAVKRIFRYLKGKPHLGLWYPMDSPFDLVAYSDSDYADASLDRKSTTGGCQFLRCRLISWQYKKSDASEGFNQVIDFLNASYIKYALTINPYIYVSYIKQFWNTVIVKQSNDVTSLVRNVDSSSKFYMYPRFIQLIIQNQLGDLSTHITKYTSPALTQKVFANMRRVGKGFSRVETPLFEGMLVAGVIEEEGDANKQVQDVATDTTAQGADTAVIRDVIQDQSIPSPTPPPQQSQDLPSTSQVQHTPPQSPQPQPQSQPQTQQQAANFLMSLLQEALDACAALTRRVEHLEYDKVAQALEITKLKRRLKKLEKANKVKLLKLKRLKKVETSQRIDSSDDTVMEDASNQERMIDDLDSDAGVALMDDKEKEKKVEEAKVAGDDQVQGRQAEIYQIDMDHASKVLSMQEDEPAEVQEVANVVTTAKLITEVVTAASESVTAASTTIAVAEPQVLAATITVVPIRSKDKGKRIMVEEPKPLKKKQHVEMDEEYAWKLHEELNKDIDWNVAIDHTKEQLEEEENRAIQSINETPAQKAAKRRKLNEEVKDLKQH
uniref:Uncharacterized mitochondrial protein AtMg00810-like n=1 Tax=Tanacetum cinerariifolium TaxID=118510 RepID=A0A6L2LW24_TANCI|nr:uncharacterized mitochondrial protein AtMg00810-like [Tanacetum cinerariifolium]